MPSVAPNFAITYRFPIYDAAATTATTRFSRCVTRGYQHRFTNYVRRVRPYRIGYAVQLARPNRFHKYPSGNHGSFRAALRRRRLCADPFGGRATSVTATSQGWNYAYTFGMHCVIT